MWLITSGPTQSPLDGFRILTNRSTGTFGTLLTEALLKKGKKVTLIHGVGSKTPDPHPLLKRIQVITNKDLERTLKKELGTHHYNVVVHAAAVLDFVPKAIAKGKKKTKKGYWNLKLIPTKKIINQIKKWSPKTTLVGFKLEVGTTKTNLLKEARRVQKKSAANYMVANELNEGKDVQHNAYLLNSAGQIIAETKGKKDLVRVLLANRLDLGGLS